MFKLKDPANQKAQKDLAAAIMSTEFQEVFNLNKGSIPVRLNMKHGQVRRLRQDLGGRLRGHRQGRLAGAVHRARHGRASATEGAIKDVVSQFWNDDKMTAKAMASSPAAAKTK
jgi:glucose/mannose transport system substrate-binding protein